MFNAFCVRFAAVMVHLTQQMLVKRRVQTFRFYWDSVRVVLQARATRGAVVVVPLQTRAVLGWVQGRLQVGVAGAPGGSGRRFVLDGARWVRPAVRHRHREVLEVDFERAPS